MDGETGVLSASAGGVALAEGMPGPATDQARSMFAQKVCETRCMHTSGVRILLLLASLQVQPWPVSVLQLIEAKEKELLE